IKHIKALYVIIIKKGKRTEYISMAYTVKLSVFEGPLDLLLHLISKAKVDIKDISISKITEQYMGYLNEMKKFDIEIASEFLVMASTLVYIKSCSLVPKRKIVSEEDDGYEDIDYQEKLIQKLIEYRQYKDISQKLQVRGEMYENVYYKAAEKIALDDIGESLLYGLTGDDLLAALNNIILDKEQKKQKA